MQYEKIITSISIIVASIIISLGYYSVQVEKQKSIERQQLAQLEQNRIDKNAEREQKNKEYVVKRKKDCYELEQSERKKYNNVDGNFYDQEKDVCKIRYVNEKWKEGDQILEGWNEKTQKYELGKYFTNDF